MALCIKPRRLSAFDSIEACGKLSVKELRVTASSDATTVPRRLCRRVRSLLASYYDRFCKSLNVTGGTILAANK